MNQPSDHESTAGDVSAEPSTTDSKGAPSQPPPGTPSAPPPDEPEPPRARPSFVLLAVVSIISLVADLGTKWWALHSLEKPLPNGGGLSTPVEITPWLTLLLARNRGGAWGLLQTANEEIRKPFFLIISVAAIAFIVYLFRKIHPKQHALKWGLPLVLGGAIGNLVDRIRYGWVIDFIDYRAEWVRWLNEQIAKLWPSHAITDHWPTFNIADVAICVGVGLMAIDMFTSRKVHHKAPTDEAPTDEAPTDEAPTDEAPTDAGETVEPTDMSSPPSSEPDSSSEQSKV